MVGSPGHKVAEQYLTGRLAAAGCQPYAGASFALPYSGEGQDFVNLVGVIPGADRTMAPVLIGAHYDSVIPHPCADDNGAAVAIALAVAEAAHHQGGLSRDLIIAMFDAEEPPYFFSDCMGSNRFYADHLDARGVHFAMIHDLVGHDISVPGELLTGPGLLGELVGNMDLPIPVLKNGVFVTGAESHPALSGLIEASLVDGIKVAASLNEYVGDMSDHGVFRTNGVPYLFLSCGRWAHYHRPTDTPDRLNYRKMARIMELSWKILQAVSEASLSGEAVGDHTVAYEIKTLKRLMGPLGPLVMKKIGKTELTTRNDIDDVVAAMLSLGL